MTSDPYAIGMREGDVSFYCGRLTAQAQRDREEDVRYSQDDLYLFKGGFVDRDEVDRSVEDIGDLSLKAEVHRYRCACAEIVRLQQEIDVLQGRKYTAVCTRDGAVRRLEEAYAIQRIEEETARRRARAGPQVIQL